MSKAVVKAEEQPLLPSRKEVDIGRPRPISVIPRTLLAKESPNRKVKEKKLDIKSSHDGMKKEEALKRKTTSPAHSNDV